MAVAVTKDKSKALAALTTAALGLPGLETQAATAITNAQGNVMYGHYQESSNRMHVDVYHGDFVVPITEHLEFAYSIDRDTYSGATPAFSMPAEMANQPKYKDAGTILADVISAASGGVTASGMTILGGINNFKKFIEARDAGINAFVANNPRPPDPPPTQTIQDTIINFTGLPVGIYGKGNYTPLANGDCAVFNSSSCFYQGGMLVGTVWQQPTSASDGINDQTHLHKGGTVTNPNLYYHQDSGGIYLRAQSLASFGVQQMLFKAPTFDGNPNTGPNDYWQILGFSNAINTNISQGDGVNYPNVVASQTVPNGFNGTLTLNPAFQNINALWIHYNGFPARPADTSGAEFQVAIDDLLVKGVTVIGGKTPAQIAWENARDKYATIYQYSTLLNTPISPNTKIVQRFQEMPWETRTQPVFTTKYYLDETVLAFSGGWSEERDFNSTFGSLNIIREFNDKHTTATFGYSYTSNQIYRSTDYSHSSSHHDSAPEHNPTNYAPLNETSNFNAFNLSIAQVMSKNTLLQLSGVFTNQAGYLSNPYKFVYIRGEITPEEYYTLFAAGAPGEVNWKSISKLEVVGSELFRENRPRERNQGSINIGLSQHFPEVEGSLNADYRFFADTWNITSHTFELKWYQPIGHGIMITPNIRYYSQSAADFFAPYFLAPRADGYYSSDFRLSAYGAVSGGITFTKSFTKGISLQAGFEYYTHQGNLKLGGGGENPYADYNYYVVTGGLNFNLSSPGFTFVDHHHHHHHGVGEAPAGVMYAHLMEGENDLMLGYRYFYSNQGGSMFNGTESITDRNLVYNGCETFYCLSKPHNMSMHMHMFEVMYAPTDWLNLMVMPMLMDMDMTTTPIVSGATDEHSGGHSTSGMGDTIMMSLIKLYGDQTHKVIGGIGFSAPTGSVNMTISGTPNTELQDYGMQLGSGTWDFRPVLTYTGFYNQIAWGVQVNGIKRMEGRNSSGYSLGDLVQTSAWGSYNPTNWFQASIRGLFTWQGAIRGQFNSLHSASSPVDFPSNYGGRFWDVGFGLNFSVPDGEFFGHKASVEWLQPVSSDFNGYQLERTGTLAATWTYSF